MSFVSIKTIEFRFPLSKVDIDTSRRKAVVACDRLAQLLRIDADPSGETRECIASLEVPRFQPARQVPHVCRLS